MKKTGKGLGISINVGGTSTINNFKMELSNPIPPRIHEFLKPRPVWPFVDHPEQKRIDAHCRPPSYKP